MANQTVKDAISIKGTNPQYLVEKIVRSRIYDARYWKEECFGLTAELVVDKAMELKSVGGIYGGNVKPTPFLCLILKMLQIQPEKDIIVEFIRNEDFKYMRALGAFYMRLTGTAADVYKYLEPLYIDYRKMKRMNKNAKYELVHMDEFIDELLHGERVCDVSMPRLQKRYVLEETNELEPRISPLEVNLDEAESDEEEEESEASEASDKEDKKKSDRNNRKKDDRDDDRRRNDKDENNGRDKKRSDRGRYVDYDRPDDDDVKFYEKRRERTPERHQHRSSSSRHQHESHSSKRGSSRERDRDRDRERDRDRNRDRSRDRDASSKKSSSSKRRDRSKDRSHHH